jgi:hypothetical protein
MLVAALPALGFDRQSRAMWPGLPQLWHPRVSPPLVVGGVPQLVLVSAWIVEFHNASSQAIRSKRMANLPSWLTVHSTRPSVTDIIMRRTSS